MGRIPSPERFNLESMGHSILSTHPDHFNQILVSEKRKDYDLEGYMNSTPIIREISYGADEFLNNHFSAKYIGNINSTLNDLIKAYHLLDFDPIFPYSIVKNAALKFPIETKPISQRDEFTDRDLSHKSMIFYSAQDRSREIKEWSQEFPRYKKQDLQVSEPKRVFQTKDKENLEGLGYKDYSHKKPMKPEDYKLRFEKSKRVEEKILPYPPIDNIENILTYVRQIIEQEYDMPSLGKAFGLARDYIRNLHPVEYQTIKWELSKLANLYEKRELSLGLPPKEKADLLEKVNTWLNTFEEERLEKERKEQEEKERKAREKLEKERKEQEEKERKEKERLEKERLERLRKEKKQIELERRILEEERIEREKIQNLKEEQERLKRRRKKEKMEFERQQKLMREQKLLEKEKLDQETLEREARELKALKKERKRKAKVLKKQKKREKKLEKKRKKLERKKAKEKKKLEKIKSKLKSEEKSSP